MQCVICAIHLDEFAANHLTCRICSRSSHFCKGDHRLGTGCGKCSKCIGAKAFRELKEKRDAVHSFEDICEALSEVQNADRVGFETRTEEVFLQLVTNPDHVSVLLADYRESILSAKRALNAIYAYVPEVFQNQYIEEQLRD